MKIVTYLNTFILFTAFNLGIVKVYEIDYRIVGGIKAEENQFPWQVGIYLVKNTSSNFCGGALISRLWVLTAAHCLMDSISAEVIVGTTRIYSILEILHLSFLQPGERYEVIRFIAHEEFEKGNLVNDIALLKLGKPVDRQQTVLTLDDNNIIQPNMYISISGWGRTGNRKLGSTNLMYINMLAMSTSKCQSFYKSKINDNTTFCVIGKGSDNICVGDSGGAAIYYRHGEPIHVGILSFLHSSGCEMSIPVGLTRTAYFREWIKSKSGI